MLILHLQRFEALEDRLSRGFRMVLPDDSERRNKSGITCDCSRSGEVGRVYVLSSKAGCRTPSLSDSRKSKGTRSIASFCAVKTERLASAKSRKLALEY